jgi:hypothetical protein
MRRAPSTTAIRATSTIIAVLDPVKARVPPAACGLAGRLPDKLLAPGRKPPVGAPGLRGVPADTGLPDAGDPGDPGVGVAPGGVAAAGAAPVNVTPVGVEPVGVTGVGVPEIGDTTGGVTTGGVTTGGVTTGGVTTGGTTVGITMLLVNETVQVTVAPPPFPDPLH